MNAGIRKVLVVGAGTIGTQVAGLMALRGLDTALYDIDPARPAGAMEEIGAMYRDLAAGGVIGQEDARAALGRLRPLSDPAEAARDADLLNESVPEDLELKRRVLARFNTLCKPEAIFTTNTSDLLPSMMAEASGRPGLFAAFHFHAPLRGADLVDVMPHPGTAPETTARLRQFAVELGLAPIVLERERPGYVFNNLLNALNRAALDLVVDGVATPQTVDMAWKRVMRSPIGPFGILDRVGLDTALRIARLGAEHTNDEGLWRIVEYLSGHVEAGRLGVRSGRGFYVYDGSGPGGSASI